MDRAIQTVSEMITQRGYNITSEDNEKIIINSNDTNQYYKKVVKPSKVELKLHKEYLKNSLKKNFFN